MFERFTDRARRVVVLAQEEARMLNHNHIGTEHILLGLIHEGEGVAAKALESLGIGLEAVRQQVEEIIGQGQQPPSGHIPFTPRAKKVLELSLREATLLATHVGALALAGFAEIGTLWQRGDTRLLCGVLPGHAEQSASLAANPADAVDPGSRRFPQPPLDGAQPGGDGGEPVGQGLLAGPHPYLSNPAVAVAVQHLDDLLPGPVQVGAEPDEDLRGHPVALADQAEQDVLGADVVVPELDGLAQP